MRSFGQKAPQPTSDTRRRPLVALNPIQQLQRRVGNQALQRMAQAHAGKATEDVAARGTLIIQPKLTINTPGDVHEQEADRVAEQVMRMPDSPVQSRAPAGNSGNAVTPAARVQTKSTQAGGGGAAAPPIVHDVLRSPGEPLSSDTRAFMEPRFGQDFGDVRMHTDGRSASASQAIGAKAFTHGQDVVFGSGQYRPDTTSGRELIAHELTHVVQQGGVPSASAVQRQISTGYIDHGASAHAMGTFDAATGIYTVPSNKSVYHDQTKAYDSWYSIAKRFNTSPETILKLNGGAGATLKPGKSVKIPKPPSGTETGYQPIHDGPSLPKIRGTTSQTKTKTKTVPTGDEAKHLKVEGKLAEEVAEGMEIANTSGRAQYPHIALGGQVYPEGYIDPAYWAPVNRPPDQKGVVTRAKWNFTLKPGQSASKAVDALFNGPARLECLSMISAVLARAVKETIGSKRFDLNFGAEGKMNQDLTIGTNTTELQHSKLRSMIVDVKPATAADLKPGDWVYFWNCAQYRDKHPGGAWGGENAIVVSNDKGIPLFSGFGAGNKTEEQMNRELWKAYNKDLKDLKDTLSFPVWKQQFNRKGGKTGLSLESTKRLDSKQIETMLK